MYKLVTSLLALSLLSSCGDLSGDGDDNPLLTGRAAKATVSTTGGSETLNAVAVTSSQAAGVRNTRADSNGRYLLNVTIPSDGQSPSVTTGLSIYSSAPIEVGTYPVVETTAEGAHAVVSLTISRQSPAQNAIGVGTGGTVKITSLSNNRASGEFTINGRGSWLAGATGDFTFTVAQGTFTDVFITDVQ